MIHVLYFQAYLSLPEGTASVVGLIAMMTDHYTVLVSSNLISTKVLDFLCLLVSIDMFQLYLLGDCGVCV